MASAIRSLNLVVVRASACRIPGGVRRAPRIAPRHTQVLRAGLANRNFSACARRRADEDESSSANDGDGRGKEMSADEIALKVLDDMAEAGHPISESEIETFQSLRRSADEEAGRGDIYGNLQRDMETAGSIRDMDGIPRSVIDEPELAQVEIKQPLGFFAEDEGAEDMDEDEDFEPDDISSDAHLELEQVRELREFARVMAWDMPLLYDHRKEFQPPAKEQPLRFRYTTYMGETHPASKKVVLDFSPSNLPNLTPTQKSKLIKLLGSRYNPQTDTVRMSSELHPTPAQNKRHLASTLDAILKECREGKDAFEDVPFDFRHHREKIVHEFPEEWKLTDERRKQLDQVRSQQIGDGGGASVDGRRLIETMLSSGPAPQQQQERDGPVGAGGQQRGGGATRQNNRR